MEDNKRVSRYVKSLRIVVDEDNILQKSDRKVALISFIAPEFFSNCLRLWRSSFIERPSESMGRKRKCENLDLEQARSGASKLIGQAKYSSRCHAYFHLSKGAPVVACTSWERGSRYLKTACFFLFINYPPQEQCSVSPSVGKNGWREKLSCWRNSIACSPIAYFMTISCILFPKKESLPYEIFSTKIDILWLKSWTAIACTNWIWNRASSASSGLAVSQ